MKTERSDLTLKVSRRMIVTWLGYLINEYKGVSFCKLVEQAKVQNEGEEKKSLVGGSWVKQHQTITKIQRRWFL